VISERWIEMNRREYSPYNKNEDAENWSNATKQKSSTVVPNKVTVQTYRSTMFMVLYEEDARLKRGNEMREDHPQTAQYNNFLLPVTIQNQFLF
jgi:hypothetical protein